MKTVFSLACLLALASSCVLVAGHGDRTDAELAEILMRQSGLSKQLEQVPLLMDAALIKARSNDAEMQEVPQPRFEEFRRMTRDAFNATTLKEAVRQRLKSGLTRKDTIAALTWFNSPLGKKITAIEEEASRPDTYRERQKALNKTPGPADRILLIRKLDSAVKGTQSALNAYLSAQVALVTVLTSELPPRDRPAVDEILTLMRNMEPDWSQSAEREILLFFLDTYRPFTDDELDRYIAFAGSAPGQTYHALVLDSVMDAMLQASRELWKQLEPQTARTGGKAP